MKYRNFFMVCLLGICANANAEWFLRGTHNAWAAAQMDPAGTNTVQLKSVVFNAAGNIKFDRFGDWKESYGLNGGNIPVAAGTWDIKFFTDTKQWAITAPQAAATYHVRGTFNAWAEGTLLTRVGNTDTYESCVNFTNGDTNGGPRFKIDPNGAWGDAVPATDVTVSLGWVKIAFNSVTKAINTQQNLTANCGGASSSSVPSSSATTSSSSSTAATSSSVVSSSVVVSSSAVSNSSVASSAAGTTYHLRGTFNAWAEGTLLTRVGTTDIYERCVNFTGGDANGGPRFKVDPNGAWGDAVPAADFSVAVGWVKVSFNGVTKAITTAQNQPANCATISSSSSSAANSSSVSSSSVVSSSSAASIYHLRGTFNAWAEGTLLNRVGTTDSYERCVNFTAGDANGGPRFKVDPNGAWGDALPNADFTVSQGWVKVAFNSTSKAISVQQNLATNCGESSASSSSAAVSSSSSVISSSVSSSVASSSSQGATVYHLRGTNNAWLEGTLLDKIGTTNIYEKCANFTAGDSNGGPRFKIDPNGAWGDAVPAADFTVAAGWVKITFNSTSKVITTQQNLPANCGAEVFHLRGTHNAWAEGDLFTSVDGIQPVWSICRNFGPADAVEKPRFKVDPNGAWGADTFPAADVAASGWTSVVIDGTHVVTTTKDLAPNCAIPVQ